MIDANHLFAAAKLARQKSKSGRMIEIMVRESGLVVRGAVRVGEREASSYLSVGWGEMEEDNADIASHAVEAVNADLTMYAEQMRPAPPTAQQVSEYYRGFDLDVPSMDCRPPATKRERDMERGL